MKILIASDWGNSTYNTGQSLTLAFRNIGCEVLSCGPTRGKNCAINLPVGGPDIVMPDRPYPELYTYKEVLDRTPWLPDFILQIEPGFYLNGEKPKGIKSGYYFTDSHCAAIMEYNAHRWAKFDYLFVGQPAYAHMFAGLALKTMAIVPPAFDRRRFDQSVNHKPACDIAFVGHSGLSLPPWGVGTTDDIGRYFTALDRVVVADERKYSGPPPSYDYAERAELLYRLSRDFDVRIYEPLWDSRIQDAIQKGRIGFNRSLLFDLSIRNLEVAASGRLLVTDRVQVVKAPRDYPLGTLLYPTGLHRPFYENFSMTYETVRSTVERALQMAQDESLAEASRKDAFEFHTWENRAAEIREVFLGKGRRVLSS